jgi:segregation and condensation protein A
MMTIAQDAALDDSSAPAGFVVALDGFIGPLDLLLHLVREERIDIADIQVARIADQFLAAIHALGLNQAADYLEMAGRLIRLKVQLLLPRHGDEEDWTDPRAELVRRLLEYQQIKEIAREFGRLAERRALRLARGYLPPAPDLPPVPIVFDVMAMLLAVEEVIRGIPSPVLHRVITRPLDVEGAVARIEALLALQDEFDWRAIFGNRATIVDVLSALLALLELARRGSCRVRQVTPFSSLVVSRELVESALPAG